MNALIIFVKNPVAGKTKTRLAKDVGNDRALAIYHSLLDYTRTVCSMVDADRFLFYSDQIVDDKWPASHFIKEVQHGDNLGARMGNAFEHVLKKHDKVLIIGSDCPQLDLMTISNAYQQLESHDYVIGPSVDGGYYLFGMKAYSANVFHDIEWSTESVLSQTIDRIQQENKTHSLLQELSDVDYKEDWEKYGWDL